MSTNELVRIVVIVASIHPARRADEILRLWLDLAEPTARDAGAILEIADLRAWGLPFGAEPEEPHTGRYRFHSTTKWAALVGGADAFVVLTPEHNHSLPAALKNAFDLLGSEWSGKPVSWVSYGNTSAGTRAALAGKQVAATLGMFSVGPDVSLRLAELGDAGVLEGRDESARRAVNALVHHAVALRALRRKPLAIRGLPSAYIAHLGDGRDAGELLVLQRACWVDEALVNQSFDIPALHEDLATVEASLAHHRSVMVRRGGRLVASVQSWAEEETWWIGRLMVAADHRRRGLARVLLQHAQRELPSGMRAVALMTGAASESNLRFYQSEGFVIQPPTGPGVVHLVKRLEQTP